MPEKMTFEKTFDFENFEREINPDKVKTLPDWEEPGAYYRGVKAEDAFMAIFGELKLDAHPKEDIIGTHDNASVNHDEAVYFSPTSGTNKGKKFLCAIGFIPLPTAKIEDSFLGKSTFARITGPVLAREVVLRFAGRKPGQPQKRVKYFSPKEFYLWYKENVA